MPRKTRKVSRKQRRKTLRRIPKKLKKGGSNLAPPNGKALMPPDSAFGEKIGAPVNSDNVMQKIA